MWIEKQLPLNQLHRSSNYLAYSSNPVLEVTYSGGRWLSTLYSIRLTSSPVNGQFN